MDNSCYVVDIEQFFVDIQNLLHEFVVLFEAPSVLFPSRVFDHTIPLILGASPVNIRPY